MESVGSEVVYKIRTFAEQVEEKFRNVYADGYGDGAVFVVESMGWYALFTHSHEALYLGKDKPAIQTGDAVEITIRKI